MTITNQKTRPELGDEVKDLVSGFVGIETSATDYLNGCRRICVYPPVKADNTFGDERYFDDTQIEVIEKGKVKPNPAIAVNNPEFEKPPAFETQRRAGGDRPDPTPPSR